MGYQNNDGGEIIRGPLSRVQIPPVRFPHPKIQWPMKLYGNPSSVLRIVRIAASIPADPTAAASIHACPLVFEVEGGAVIISSNATLSRPRETKRGSCSSTSFFRFLCQERVEAKVIFPLRLKSTRAAFTSIAARGPPFGGHLVREPKRASISPIEETNWK